MLAIDTLKTTRRFQEAGLPPEQADAFTEILKDAQEQNVENLASKNDIALLRKDLDSLRKDIDQLRREQERFATKEDLAETKAELKDEIASVKADVLLLKWMQGFVLAGILALLLRAFFGA